MAVKGMNKEKVKAMVKGATSPTGDYIKMLAFKQFEIIGNDMTYETFKSGGYQHIKSNTMTKAQFAEYKAYAIDDLMGRFNYDIAKANAEFNFFVLHYGMKIKGYVKKY